MTIFLHIGLNKAGSSSLQASCHEHRSLLRKNGLEYPQVGIHDAAHYGFSKRLIGHPKAADVNEAEGLESAISSAVAAGRHVLLSSEYLFLAHEEQVDEVKNFLAQFGQECRIIVYLRRHDLWFASLFNQAVKTAPKYSFWHSDIREYTMHMLGSREVETRYSVVLDRWAARFGRDAMRVRPFEIAQFRDREFLWDALGLIDPALPKSLARQGMEPIRINESLPEHVLRAVDFIRSIELPDETKRSVISLLVRSPAVPQATHPGRAGRRTWDQRVFVLPPYLRKSLLNMFAGDYRYIAEQYLEAKDAVLFGDPIA